MPIFPYAYQEHTLDNGLRVILIPMESPGLVSYHTVVRTGSRDEVEPGKTGFAHFFEHMMFRGTEKYPGPVYDGLMTQMGIDANAYTTDDRTVYHLDFTAEDLEKVIELESDRFQNLSYKEADFQTEAGAVYGEYRKSITSPFSVLFESVSNLAYDKHTYKHTTIGFEEDIKAMPQQFEYSKGFFKRFYRPDNCVIVVTGDFKPEQTLSWIKQYYGGWQKGYQAPQVVPEPEQTAERRGEVQFNGKTLPILYMGYKTPAFNPRDKASVATFALGELFFGSNSDLYKDIYLEKQWVNFVSYDASQNRDPGLFSIYSMVKDPANIEKVQAAIDAAVKSAQDQPVTSVKLDGVKKRIKYGLLMDMNTPGEVAESLDTPLAVEPSIKGFEAFFSTLQQLEPADLQAAAKAFFQTQRRTVVVLKGAQ